MTMLPQSRCLQPGCRVLVQSGRCDAHKKAYNKGIKDKRKDRDALYATAQWKESRQRFLQAHPMCAHCNKQGIVKEAEAIDHIIPVSAGAAFWDQSNWQSLCKSCHSRKTQLDLAKQRRRGGAG